MRMQPRSRQNRLSDALDFFDYVYAFMLLGLFATGSLLVVGSWVYVFRMLAGVAA